MILNISNRCIGCGVCSIINPEIFSIEGNKATANHLKIEGNENDCIDAALNCPVDAIRIED